MSEEQLQALCEEWQGRLRLQDWTVRLRVKRRKEMASGHGEIGAEVDCLLDKKLADINILDERDYQPDCMVPEDQELALVHELLHLHLWPCNIPDSSKPEGVAEEQAIHAISVALVALKREAFVAINEVQEVRLGRPHSSVPSFDSEQAIPEKTFGSNGCRWCGEKITDRVHPAIERDGELRRYHEECFDKAKGTRFDARSSVSE